MAERSRLLNKIEHGHASGPSLERGTPTANAVKGLPYLVYVFARDVNICNAKNAKISLISAGHPCPGS
jgi:hypothetical protein